MLDKKIEEIKKDYNDSPDIIFRKVKLKDKEILLVFSTSTTSSDSVNDFILKKLVNIKTEITRDNIYNHFENIIPENVLVDIKDKDDMYSKIGAGFTIVIFDKGKPFGIETRKDLSRGVSEPLTEQSISGPKDSFTENYETNLGLIRKRIKTNKLSLKELQIGKQSKTQVAVLFMNNIAEEELVNDIIKKLETINTDGVFDSTTIRDYIEEVKSTFPTIITTERPDRACMSLLEGKVLIAVENSPYLLVIPSFFTDLFQSAEDNYQSNMNVSFTRIIRYGAFFLAILLPAFYVAITTFNHETIPVTLLINFAAQREGVPFPAIVEALGLILVFEILRESDIRMPHLAGTAISILGAIVLGDAAVAAGIVSPIMVIIIALSAIASLMFSDVGIVNAIRFWRILFMLLATLMGIVGIFFAGILLTVKLTSLRSFGKPYLYPLIPLDKKFLFNSLIKRKKDKENMRMPILTDKNYKRSDL